MKRRGWLAVLVLVAVLAATATPALADGPGCPSGGDTTTLNADTVNAIAAQCATLDADITDESNALHGDIWVLVGAVIGVFVSQQVLRFVWP